MEPHQQLVKLFALGQFYFFLKDLIRRKITRRWLESHAKNQNARHTSPPLIYFVQCTDFRHKERGVCVCVCTVVPWNAEKRSFGSGNTTIAQDSFQPPCAQ